MCINQFITTHSCVLNHVAARQCVNTYAGIELGRNGGGDMVGFEGNVISVTKSEVGVSISENLKQQQFCKWNHVGSRTKRSEESSQTGPI